MIELITVSVNQRRMRNPYLRQKSRQTSATSSVQPRSEVQFHSDKAPSSTMLDLEKDYESDLSTRTFPLAALRSEAHTGPPVCRN